MISTRRRTKMLEIGELVVCFERDWAPRRYPYLGQCCLLGVDHTLLEGFDCKKPVEFSPHYGSPAAQVRMGEVLTGKDGVADRFEDLLNWTPPPFWVLPAEGWRTARCLQAALQGGAVNAGVVDIIGPLSAEVDDWVELMEAAVDADIRFQVDLQECSNPPEDLVTWAERDAEDTVQMIIGIMEDAGIRITDNKPEDVL
jgi:hypothetical protein